MALHCRLVGKKLHTRESREATDQHLWYGLSVAMDLFLLRVFFDLFLFDILFFAQDVCSRLDEDSVMPVSEEIDNAQEFVPLVPASVPTSTHGKHDQGTQRPVVPLVAYKDQTERGKREMRAELISNIKHMALPSVLFEESNMMQFITDVVNSKTWAATFGVDSTNARESCNPILQSLVKNYKDCMSKEKAKEVQKKAAAQKAKILIGSSLKDSRLTLLGDKTPEEFKNRVATANSVGRMTYFA